MICQLATQAAQRALAGAGREFQRAGRGRAEGVAAIDDAGENPTRDPNDRPGIGHRAAALERDGAVKGLAADQPGVVHGPGRCQNHRLVGLNYPAGQVVDNPAADQFDAESGWGATRFKLAGIRNRPRHTCRTADRGNRVTGEGSRSRAM